MKTLLKARQQYEQTSKEIEDKNTIIVCEDESLTIQDAPDADLNVLMERMGVTNRTPLPATLGVTDPSYYGDFTNVPTNLMDAMEVIRGAEERFAELPPQIREKFDNNALKMLNWVHNPDNFDEAVELKMLRKEPLTKPAAPPPSPPDPAPPVA